jgi:hypothetical protein
LHQDSGDADGGEEQAGHNDGECQAGSFGHWLIGVCRGRVTLISLARPCKSEVSAR